MELSRYLEETRSRLEGRELVYLAALAALVIAAVFLREYLVGMLLLTSTVAFSVLVKRADLNALGLELGTFSTVVAGLHFGPETGAVMGVLLMLSQALTGRPGVYVVWVTPTYALTGYLAGSLTGYSVAVLGTGLAAGMQLVFALFTAAFSRDRLGEYLPYAAFNLAFNMLLFHTLAPTLLEILAAGPAL